MESEWTETTLGQVVEEGEGLIQTGPFGSQLHASDYKFEGIPVIMPVNISSDRVDVTDIARISREDADRLSKHLVEPGDIVYSRRGDVTRKALITENETGMFCGTGCLLVRPGKEIDPRFLKYHLSSPTNQAWIIRHAVGATMPNLNTGILGDVPLRVPSRGMQKAIAHILGTLDDKIELNRRMNATLESMARALFKSWFVDFDPVIDNALAAGNPIPEPLSARAQTRGDLGPHRKPLPKNIQKLFPDTFVFNDEIGWVPEGWGVTEFGEILESTIGGDWGKEEQDEKHALPVVIIRGADIPDVKQGRRGKIPDRWVEGKKFESRELRDGDIVIEVSGGSPARPTGRSVYINQNIINRLGGQVVPASFCRRFRPKTELHGLYASLHLEAIYAAGKMWGYQIQSTGIANFQTKTFLKTEQILNPGIELLEECFARIRPLKDRATSDEQETLTKLRDTLLPKLLSGELRIPDAEKLVAGSL